MLISSPPGLMFASFGIFRTSRIMPTRTTPNDLLKLRRGLGADFARLFSLYGLNPLYGRIYALLFLSLRPVSLDDGLEVRKREQRGLRSFNDALSPHGRTPLCSV